MPPSQAPDPKEPPPSPRSLLPPTPLSPPANTLLIGYTSNRKKQKQFFSALSAVSETHVVNFGPRNLPISIKLIPFETPADLSYVLTLNLHAVIHKRTDDMASVLAAADTNAMSRLSQLDHLLNNCRPFRPSFGDHLQDEDKTNPMSKYLPTYPLVAVDPMEGVWKLLDRINISEAVDNVFSVEARHHPFEYPTKVKALNWTALPIRQGIQAVILKLLQHNLTFPLILKRRLACGTKASHEMVIAHDMDGVISALKTIFASTSSLNPAVHSDPVATSSDHFAQDLIAQQYITNHGSVLFKVYAIGNNVVVQPRASVEYLATMPTSGFYCFDSQKLSRATHFCFDPLTGRSDSTAAIMPSQELAAAIVAKLCRELGLTLIGVDLVYNIDNDSYSVVDINYFPGYKGLAKAHEWMLQHICNRVSQQLQI